MTSRTGLSRTGFARWWGAACGLLAAVAAIGIGQLFAGFTIPAASPVVAVGEAAIDHTPLPVKDWATSTFGTNDKTVLIAGVVVVVFLYSMLVGVLAMRRLALGFAGLTIFAGIGLAAALTRHDASGSYAVPTIFGAIAGAIALSWLVVTARAAALAGQERRAARAAHAEDRLPPIAFEPDRPDGRDAGYSGAGRSPEVAGPEADDTDDDSIGWVAAHGPSAAPGAEGGAPGSAAPGAGPARLAGGLPRPGPSGQGRR